ncbi:MAG TPA: YraN family protein [Candidatus Baltobacteraceae bacterium]|nr:YraN family protein [Candidatus Baltobacteraceae bacterium]
MSTSRKGRRGEDVAAAFLTECGYRVIARNLRTPGGEIDLVAVDGSTLVFVEIKRREGHTFGSALAAVDARKRHRLRAIAADYAQIVAPRARIRFDIVTIDGNRLALHRNAF